MVGRRVISALAVTVLAAGTARADMLTYENERFGTTITFPLDVFDSIDPPPANGDGRRFRSEDGAELAAYGKFNTLDQTPKSLIDWEADILAKDGGKVTYSGSGDDWAVLSGTIGDTIFYQRHEFSGDGSVIYSMDLRYPMLGSAHYDRLAGQIAETLKGR